MFKNSTINCNTSLQCIKISQVTNFLVSGAFLDCIYYSVILSVALPKAFMLLKCFLSLVLSLVFTHWLLDRRRYNTTLDFKMVK